MPVYKFTSDLFTGMLFFEYEKGMLTKFANYSEMGDMQLTWLSANFPTFENMIEAMTGKSGKAEIVQKQTDFENFKQFMKK